MVHNFYHVCSPCKLPSKCLMYAIECQDGIWFLTSFTRSPLICKLAWSFWLVGKVSKHPNPKLRSGSYLDLWRRIVKLNKYKFPNNIGILCYNLCKRPFSFILTFCQTSSRWGFFENNWIQPFIIEAILKPFFTDCKKNVDLMTKCTRNLTKMYWITRCTKIHTNNTYFNQCGS